MHCWETLPEAFIAKATMIYGKDRSMSVLSTFCNEKPISVRVNTIKTTIDHLVSVFTQNNILTETVPWYEHALLVTRGTKKELTALPAYQDGLFYIQNLSSMLPSIILDPKPGETVLDLCAAPGSKTSHMAMLMNNSGTIVANDLSRQRLFKLAAILKQQGVINVKTHILPGEHMWRRYPNHFDKTLVDVPCSMEGRFLAADNSTFADWSPKKVKRLTHMQQQLLRSAFIATKPGGTLVYSTCTLSPEENESVIDWLLRTETYPFTVEKVHVPHAPLTPPLHTWEGKAFGEYVKNAIRIIPDTRMEGFFLAKIQKEAL